MTLLEAAFSYASPPGERELQALNRVRQVFGIRKTWFDEKARIINVEYDASRLTQQDIAVCCGQQEWTLASSSEQAHDSERRELFTLTAPELFRFRSFTTL